MLERVLWLLICGTGASIATHFWKKSVLDNGKWYWVVILICLCMLFGVSKFFNSTLMTMMMSAFFLMIPALWFAKIIFVTALENNKDDPSSIERLKQMNNYFIVMFWIVFIVALLITS